MSTFVYVTKLPKCDICGEEAAYDAATKQGPWAYLCRQHFDTHTQGIVGTGYGQELRLLKPKQEKSN